MNNYVVLIKLFLTLDANACNTEWFLSLRSAVCSLIAFTYWLWTERIHRFYRYVLYFTFLYFVLSALKSMQVNLFWPSPSQNKVYKSEQNIVFHLSLYRPKVDKARLRIAKERPGTRSAQPRPSRARPSKQSSYSSFNKNLVRGIASLEPQQNR